MGSGVSSEGFSSSSTAADVAAKYGANARDKRIVITGANTGIGFETAVQLAKAGGNVVLACRNEQLGLEAQRKCRELSGNNTATYMQLDLGDFDAIRRFAGAYKQHNSGHLDLLINNAGVMMCPFQKSANGIELQLATNHFGHFLLVAQLLDQLRGGSRVVQVASQGHRHAPHGGIKFESYNDEATYNRIEAYGQSKLANIYFARELNRRYAAQGITAVSLHPGVIHTELTRHLHGALASTFWFVAAPFTKSVPQGAATNVYCALAPSVQGGRYYWDAQLGAETDLAKDDAIAQKLWDLSNRICNTNI